MAGIPDPAGALHVSKAVFLKKYKDPTDLRSAGGPANSG